jgi:copper chaperone
MEKITLPIQGMTCMGCVSSVKRVLNEVPGVGSADVSLEKAQAEVTYDPGQTGPETLKAAITDAGYDVT